MQQWVKEIELLSQIAEAYPHVAYMAFVYVYQHKFTYLMRTVPDIPTNLEPLENTIRNSFLKAVLNVYVCNDQERKLFFTFCQMWWLSYL